MVPLRASDLPELVDQIQRRLQQVNSLLDIERTEPNARMRFPKPAWDQTCQSI
jgi:hypothetical protein